MGARLLIACAWLCLAASAQAQTLAFVADINGRYGSTHYNPRVGDAVAAIVAAAPDAVISAGDMIAGQKQPELDRDHIDTMWRVFNDQVGGPLAQAGIPLAVTPGNHDGSAFPQFALERERFEEQWRDRTAGLDILPGSEWPWRYAARVGKVLLISFDGTMPGLLPERERGFVAQMLERHAAPADAIVVFSHLPMWPLTRGREHEILEDPELLTLLQRHGVDLYVSGHHHAFYAGTDESGMVHLAVGALGGNSRHYSDGASRQPHSFAIVTFSETSLGIEAPAAPGFSEGIGLDVLPARIDGPLGTLKRLDGSTVPLHGRSGD